MNARELTLTTIGLSLHDDLLIKSLLQIVNARTRDHWHFRDDLDADVALCDPESALVPLAQKHAQRSGVPRCISLMHEGLTPITGTSVLAAPIRAADFIAMLDAVSVALATSRPNPAAYLADGVNRNTTAIATPSFGFALHSLLAESSSNVYRIESENVVLHIIPATRLLLHPQPLSEDEIAQLLRTPTTMRVTELSRDGAQRLLDDARIHPYPIDTLLWQAGLRGPQDRLLPSLPHAARFLLRRWPDFGRLKHEQSHFRMAALLTRAPHNLDELVSASAQTYEVARSFINACALCDLIDVRLTAPVRATAVPAVTASLNRPSSRYAGIFRSIRSALGFLQLPG